MARRGGMVMHDNLKIAGILLFSTIGVLLPTSAGAATIENSDGEQVVVIIAEGDSRTQVVLGAGASQTVCPNGCFVTLPSGDRVVLEGKDSMQILNKLPGFR